MEAPIRYLGFKDIFKIKKTIILIKYAWIQLYRISLY